MPGMRTWARMVAAGVTLVAGAGLVLTELLSRGLNEDEGPGGSNLVLAIGVVLLVLGAGAFATSWAVAAAAVLLGVVLVYGWSGDVPNGAGEVYAVIAAVALLALGALACFRRAG